jgi:selenocysteine lyase/cysteine desulfurase
MWKHSGGRSILCSKVTRPGKWEFTRLTVLDAIYLDHAGTTLYSKSLMEAHMADMMSDLYGNPHSGSPSSQLSTSRIEDIRHKVLQFFRADPDEFDVVFVANATAGIKLVMECLHIRAWSVYERVP